jgi:DNA-binding PucR family transcriptional regulator
VLLPLLSSGSRELVTTLETYLDHGGNSARTASELHLHRTTLYHRLRQAERVCGVDLGSGEDRLILHMALRLWRLAGQPEAIA